jgi:two-component system CheB/CheR fusion protein
MNPNSIEKTHYVIGIGASAGGLEALEMFFSNIPTPSNFSFSVIQHLSPDYRSLMPELLEKHTDMKVQQVEDGMLIYPNNVYMIPPNKNMIIFKNKLFLVPQDRYNKLSLPINIFLESLAKDKKEKGIAVILSGTGSDE